ncbi:flavin-containing monooxygenase [Nocardia puris]|uniref:flavin-containing monooxygenase n=1 Tax=Nocardia puris TaxID=208602 RepID=UPI00226BC80C|nr:NAD(P)/FAD-dependent oxidoreductase [Nocardia puris]
MTGRLSSTATGRPRRSHRYQLVVVGAGFGGIGMAAALRASEVIDDNFLLVDAGSDIGGVWRDNTYPGCSCDVPAHLYSYSHSPYRDATVRYPGQAATLDYLRGVAEANSLAPVLRLKTAISAATYRDPGYWDLTTASGEVISTDIVVFAVGQLHRPKLPDIPGRESFAGPAFHTARWDHRVDLTDRDVTVIGTGSSAAQILPHVAERAERVRLYQRNPHWVMPKPGDDFGPMSQAALRIPGAHALYRCALDLAADVVLAPIMRRGWSAVPAERMARRYLRRTITDPRLRQQLTPDYPIGGKRIILDSRYYPTLNRENVELVTEPITAITPTGVATTDRHRRAEVIIYATGFHATDFLAPITVHGRDGRVLAHQWRSGPTAFLGTLIEGYPNLFLLAGPNTFSPAHSNPAMKEHQIDYIIQALRWRREIGAQAIEVDVEVAEDYQRRLDHALSTTVWTATPSWFTHSSGRLTNPWPSSRRAFAHALRTPWRHLRPIPTTG